jgi:hypothetical protein
MNRLIARFGEDVTNHQYSKDPKYYKTAKPLSDLQRARLLYFKHEIDSGSVSLLRYYESLADTADTMNFESNDSICGNA